MSHVLSLPEMRNNHLSKEGVICVCVCAVFVFCQEALETGGGGGRREGGIVPESQH